MNIPLLTVILWLAALNGAPNVKILSTAAVTVPGLSAYGEFEAEVEVEVEVEGIENMYVVFSGVRQGTKNNEIYFRTLGLGKKKAESVPVRLSEEGLNRGPSLDLTNKILHCTWLSYSEQTGDARVAYRRSADNGGEWSPVQTFSVGRSRTRYPTIVTQEDLVLIVGSNQPEGEPEKLYLFRSEDGGGTWSSVDVNFPDRKREGASNPQLNLEAGGKAHLLWMDSSAGARAVVFSRSADGGRTWSAPVAINDDLANPVSTPMFCTAKERIYVSWTLAGPYDTRILFDVSADGGKNWGKDQLLYHENVTQVTGKLLCIDDSVLLAWSGFWNQVLKHGGTLSYKWRAKSGDWIPKGEVPSLSLYADEKKLSHFKEFDIKSVASKRTVAVFTEVVDEKAAVYASLTSNPAKGFTSAFSISQREPGFEFRFPKIKEIDRTTFAVWYSKLRVKRFDIDPVPATGELLMSLVKISG